jgi:predicted ribosomally synthesized peptide with SipW-like signal peptide
MLKKQSFRKWVPSLAGVLALGAVGISVTSSLFSDTQTGVANTFEAGTVEVGVGSTTRVCTVSDLLPGDSSSSYGSGSQSLSPCVYDVVYTGTSTAWLAVDIAVTGGPPSLYTGDGSGLQLKLDANGSTTFVSGTSYTAVNGSPTNIASGSTVRNLLVSATPATKDTSVLFNVNYLLPTLAPNALQGASASVTLTFHAVQSANQPLGSCVAGRQCNSITWS